MRVYVGTYKKYNEGNLAGEWVDLTDYRGRDDFYDYCATIHSDEGVGEMELMFQDWEDIPDGMISEGGWVSDTLWDIMSLSDDEKDAVAMWYKYIGDSDSIEYILDHRIASYDATYQSRSRAKILWLEEHLNDTGFFDGWSGTAIRYFDTESYLRDCELDSFTFVFSDSIKQLMHVFFRG